MLLTPKLTEFSAPSSVPVAPRATMYILLYGLRLNTNWATPNRDTIILRERGIPLTKLLSSETPKDSHTPPGYMKPLKLSYKHLKILKENTLT